MSSLPVNIQGRLPFGRAGCNRNSDPRRSCATEKYIAEFQARQRALTKALEYLAAWPGLVKQVIRGLRPYKEEPWKYRSAK